MKLIPPLLAALLLATPPALAQTSTESPLTQSENTFALDLYAQLSKTPGNLFFSPASIATALGMVYIGARGQTATQIAHTLHIDTFQQPYLQALQSQPPFSTNTQNGIILDQANALWGAAHYNFNQSYIETIKSTFHGALTPVNFNNPTAAADKINNWVANHTAQKIQNLISPAALGPATRLVLTNAVYFKAGWETPFDKSSTSQENFYVNPYEHKQTSTMQITGNYGYSAGYNVQALELPYRDQNASMIIILPNDPFGLPFTESYLTYDRLKLLLDEMSYTPVEIKLPKFTGQSGFDLSKILKNLGIRDAFDPTVANLSGIVPPSGERLYITDAVHKAYINVDEVGTEAAATTSIMVGPEGIEVPV